MEENLRYQYLLLIFFVLYHSLYCTYNLHATLPNSSLKIQITSSESFESNTYVNTCLFGKSYTLHKVHTLFGLRNTISYMYISLMNKCLDILNYVCKSLASKNVQVEASCEDGGLN